MTIMKRLISFVLALVICLSLAATAFAATGDSPEVKPDAGTTGSAADSGSSIFNPKTGDVISLWVGSMAVSAAGLAAVAANRKKEQ